MPAPTMANDATTNDFELSRRERETRNETRIAAILGTATALAVIGQVVVRATPEAPVRPGVVQIGVGVAIVVGCAALYAYLRANPPYAAWRSSLVGLFHLVAFGSMAIASRSLGDPTLSLLVPVPMFALTVVLGGLRYKPQDVVALGAAGIVVHLVLVATAPANPARLPVAAIGIVLLAATTAAAAHGVRTLVELHGESVAKDRLRRFFAPEVVTQIEMAPGVHLGAVERDVTILFSDISGFTKMSATMAPQEVVALLNDYFPTMVDIVFRHGGTLEKYIGDALLAIWGAPVSMDDHADRALRAAIDMQRALGDINARFKRDGGREIDIHIGLNSGRVAAGHIGAENYIQYACIGDTTNVSARICSAAEAGEIVISRASRDALVAPSDFSLADRPRVHAKGKDEPLEVYEVAWR